MRTKNWKSVLALAALALAGWNAAAQDYPADRTITAVVPFAAGGPTDKVAREIVALMGQQLNTRIVVENLGGAGGTIGARKVAQAKNDGYTVLIHHIGMSTAPALYRKLGFDPLQDFEMVGEIADVPMMLVGSTKLPARSLRELIPQLRANAAGFSLANAGIGSASHLCGLILMSGLNAEMTTVPYKGTAPALVDLMAGQVNLMCDQTTNISGQLKANAIQPYAAMQPKRIGVFGEVPTAAEQGLPGIDIKIWHAMYAPKGTPRAVVDKLSAALQSAVQDSGFRSKMAELGAEAVPANKARPESLRAHLASEIGRWTAVIRKAGAFAE